MYPLANMTSSAVLQMPERIVESAWLGHIPFAMWMIQEFQPAVTVELGVHNGASLCAMAQAGSFLKYDSHFFGVDHWIGDRHSGSYQSNVYWDLKSYQLQRYRYNLTLLRKSFEEASLQFSEQSIDLLHIDGYHSYEAVKNDFTTWFPKMKSNGIIMFHDIAVTDNNFGVFKLWNELKVLYRHFHFDHSYGLGLISLGDKTTSNSVNDLFLSENVDDGALIRNYFSRLGHSIVFYQESNAKADIIRKNLSDIAELQQRNLDLSSSVAACQKALISADEAQNSNALHIANLEADLRAKKMQIDGLQALTHK